MKPFKTTEDIKTYCNKKLEPYNLELKKVEIYYGLVNMNAGITADPSHGDFGTLYISEDFLENKNFSQISRQKILHHELGHFIRFSNGNYKETKTFFEFALNDKDKEYLHNEEYEADNYCFTFGTSLKDFCEYFLIQHTMYNHSLEEDSGTHPSFINRIKNGIKTYKKEFSGLPDFNQQLKEIKKLLNNHNIKV